MMLFVSAGLALLFGGCSRSCESEGPQDVAMGQWLKSDLYHYRVMAHKTQEVRLDPNGPRIQQNRKPLVSKKVFAVQIEFFNPYKEDNDQVVELHEVYLEDGAGKRYEALRPYSQTDFTDSACAKLNSKDFDCEDFGFTLDARESKKAWIPFEVPASTQGLKVRLTGDRKFALGTIRLQQP